MPMLIIALLILIFWVFKCLGYYAFIKYRWKKIGIFFFFFGWPKFFLVSQPIFFTCTISIWTKEPVRPCMLEPFDGILSQQYNQV